MHQPGGKHQNKREMETPTKRMGHVRDTCSVAHPVMIIARRAPGAVEQATRLRSGYGGWTLKQRGNKVLIERSEMVILSHTVVLD